MALAAALADKPALTILSLGSNQIVNIDALGKALETNNTLKKLL